MNSAKLTFQFDYTYSGHLDDGRELFKAVKEPSQIRYAVRDLMALHPEFRLIPNFAEIAAAVLKALVELRGKTLPVMVSTYSRNGALWIDQIHGLTQEGGEEELELEPEPEPEPQLKLKIGGKPQIVEQILNHPDQNIIERAVYILRDGKPPQHQRGIHRRLKNGKEIGWHNYKTPGVLYPTFEEAKALQIQPGFVTRAIIVTS